MSFHSTFPTGLRAARPPLHIFLDGGSTFKSGNGDSAKGSFMLNTFTKKVAGGTEKDFKSRSFPGAYDIFRPSLLQLSYFTP